MKDRYLFYQGITEPKKKNPKKEVREGDRYLGFITGFEDERKEAIEPINDKKTKRLGV